MSMCQMCSYHAFPLRTFSLYRTLARNKWYQGKQWSLWVSNTSTLLASFSIGTAAPLQFTLTLKLAHHVTHLLHRSSDPRKLPTSITSDTRSSG